MCVGFVFLKLFDTAVTDRQRPIFHLIMHRNRLTAELCSEPLGSSQMASKGGSRKRERRAERGIKTETEGKRKEVERNRMV